MSDQPITLIHDGEDPVTGLIQAFEQKAHTNPVDTLGVWFDSNARKHHYVQVKASLWWRARARAASVIWWAINQIARAMTPVASKYLDREDRPILTVELREWDETEEEYIKRLKAPVGIPVFEAKQVPPEQIFVMNADDPEIVTVVDEELQAKISTGPITMPGYPQLPQHYPVRESPVHEPSHAAHLEAAARFAEMMASQPGPQPGEELPVVAAWEGTTTLNGEPATLTVVDEWPEVVVATALPLEVQAWQVPYEQVVLDPSKQAAVLQATQVFAIPPGFTLPCIDCGFTDGHHPGCPQVVFNEPADVVSLDTGPTVVAGNVATPPLEE